MAQEASTGELIGRQIAHLAAVRRLRQAIRAFPECRAGLGKVAAFHAMKAAEIATVLGSAGRLATPAKSDRSLRAAG